MDKGLEILKYKYSYEQVIENHLGGVLYNFYKEEEYKPIWKRQWFHNDILKSELESLGPLFKAQSIRPIVVKGVALLYDLYEDMGSRNMSDCDILVSPKEFTQTRELLILQGYKVMKTSKWFANDFKCELSKVINGREVNFEVHSKLLFHHDYETWNITALTEDFDTLEEKDHIIYMCAHLASSHSFLKLFWLFDIYFLSQKMEFDYDQLTLRAKELRVLNSLKMCFFCIDKFFMPKRSLSFTSLTYEYLFKVDFLWQVKQSGLRYFLVKHLSKDSWILAFKYDFFWLINKLSQKI